MTHADNATAAASTTRSDPRAGLKKAITLAGAALDEVGMAASDRPTPCADYTVGELSNHMVAVLRRVAVVGRGGDPFSVPNIADDVPDGQWGLAWQQAADDVTTMLDDP